MITLELDCFPLYLNTGFKSMPDKLFDTLAASGTVAALGTGFACDPVHVEYVTLNYLGVGFGALAGLLSVIYYVIRICKAVQNKNNVD